MELHDNTIAFTQLNIKLNTSNAMKTKDLPLNILTIVIIVGYFVFLFITLFNPIAEANRDIINQAAGALLMAFAAVVNYRLGSSAGSKEKTELLARAEPIKDTEPPKAE
jgi:hypothetical protein